VAAGLAAAGLDAGDRVLWCAGSSPSEATIAIGVLRAGCVLVPVNPALTERELRHVVDDTAPSALVPDAGGATGPFARLGSELHMLDPTSLVQTRAEPAPGRLDDAEADAGALILFTSGTTGSPKGALHTHASLLANAETLQDAWRWAPDDRLVHVLPLFHAHGLAVGLFGSLCAGASVVLLRRFGSGEVLEAVSEHGASLFFGVPTMYHRIAESGRAGELSRLRLAVSGSAALSADLHRAVTEAGGPAILERYGTTETLMNLSNPYDGERRPGTVGLPLAGVEIRFRADGELEVRARSCFAGYWGRPEATAAALAGGWYRTGDLASVDPDGYVRILGRSKELVISGGFNVYPAEVEAILHEHPGVAESAVTGTPSAEWGEVVTAWIVPREPESPGSSSRAAFISSVQEFAAERLAPYKRPRIVHVVESLPRNTLGKVQRHRLPDGEDLR
jgi:malonyl-CoA/methylmalonyl-CoA synthetase